MKSVDVIEILSYLDEIGVEYNLKGKTEGKVIGYSTITNYKENSITWLKSSNYQYKTGKIRVCIACDNVEVDADTIIYSSNPKMVFFRILKEFFEEKVQSKICSDSVIETKKLGKNVSIGHNCFINKDVVIGDNVVIGNNVQIECPTVIGNEVMIASGVVIGTSGYGYYQDDSGEHKRVPHFGGVMIADNVEIGANTCIDRGTMDDTYIGRNVKIDNLCHIAHNVYIDENSMVIALSMLAGSCRLGKNTYIAPGSMVKNQITINDNSFVGMGTVVLKDVPAHKTVVGIPAKILRDN